MPVSVLAPPAPSTPASARQLRRAAEDPTSLEPQELFRMGVGGGVLRLGIGSAGPAIYAHELGHAVAARAVYQGADPRISVMPWKGGATRYTRGPLTELGAALGADGARALVAGAGTLVDATSAAISFAVGYRIRKKHPVMGPALMGYGALTMLNSVLYAGTALTGSLPILARQGNDFASLAVTLGLHPLASIAILGALLPAEYLLLKTLEKHGI